MKITQNICSLLFFAYIWNIFYLRLMEMRTKLLSYLLILIGLAILGGGIYGLNSILQAENTYEHTIGIVKDVSSKKIYKYRKRKIEYEILILYNTDKYGELTYRLNSSIFFFLRKGHKMDLLYHPKLPHEVRLPIYEKTLWISLCALGIIIITGTYILVIRRNKE